MQADVKHSIIHQFYTSDGQIGLRVAPATLAINDEVGLLLTELTDVYNAKPTKGYARFITAEDDVDEQQISEFPNHLRDWRSGALDFIGLTQQGAKLLHAQLQHYGILEPGFLLFAAYTQLGQDYLVVAFLPSKEGVTIAPDLSVDRSSQLDINKVQLAAMINLTELAEQPDSNSYISFIKGRVGRKVSDFFLDFLGCAEGVNPKRQSQQLVDSVQQYVKEQELQPEQASLVRKSVYEICDNQWQQGEPVRIRDLSEQLQATVPSERSFADFSSAQNIGLAEEFPADRTTMRKLIKFQGQGGGVSVGFDQTLLGARVEYDASTDKLTIHGTPPNLRDQLRRYFGIDS
ncbi:nucleoid-associated protein NdpA [Pseudidiomarina salinarum]|uniref:Nucleoid-associated protein NdpA n=1 Tax=Pseudidiomarina salinarum TaxID=435908 RepID=A0A094IW50_9GAMM|nr:nucleoid-associated protein YejK [Pseudidiomarina salinarum]KFZ31905.1 nucleoid-associated protein NdpA [Pseudidiomarina salinarum]RUO70321.1 nucleoid-associated protein YejK [Pseudidiomarina salinarum]